MKKLKIPFNAGATTEPVGETSNLRAQDLRSFNAKNSTLSRITRRCFRIYFVAGLRPIKTKKQHPFRFFFMKSARRVAVILWMTLLCRSNDRAGRRDFEPSSPGLGSFNAKNSTLSRITRRCFRIYFVAGLRPIKTKKQSLSRMQAFIKTLFLCFCTA